MGGMFKENDPGFSRRHFLTTTTASGGVLLLAPASLSAAGVRVDPQVAQVTSRTISIDMHNHVYPAGTEPTAPAAWPATPTPGVQTVEGSHFIEGRLERVEEVYKRGLRDLQLLHEKDDMVSPWATRTQPRLTLAA